MSKEAPAVELSLLPDSSFSKIGNNFGVLEAFRASFQNRLAAITETVGPMFPTVLVSLIVRYLAITITDLTSLRPWRWPFNLYIQSRLKPDPFWLYPPPCWTMRCMMAIAGLRLPLDGAHYDPMAKIYTFSFRSSKVSKDGPDALIHVRAKGVLPEPLTGTQLMESLNAIKSTSLVLSGRTIFLPSDTDVPGEFPLEKMAFHLIPGGGLGIKRYACMYGIVEVVFGENTYERTHSTSLAPFAGCGIVPSTDPFYPRDTIRLSDNEMIELPPSLKDISTTPGDKGQLGVDVTQPAA